MGDPGGVTVTCKVQSDERPAHSGFYLFSCRLMTYFFVKTRIVFSENRENESIVRDGMMKEFCEHKENLKNHKIKSRTPGTVLPPHSSRMVPEANAKRAVCTHRPWSCRATPGIRIFVLCRKQLATTVILITIVTTTTVSTITVIGTINVLQIFACHLQTSIQWM